MKTLLRFLFAAVLSLLGSTLLAGNLTVTLSPSQAVNAGAKWRVDGGSWRNSGTTVKNLSNTAHTVDFRDVSGWLTPAATSVLITSGNTTSLSATYVQPASLKITLSPTSGQWRIDGGAWRASGLTVTGLTPGNHTVDYASASGYASPATETITLITNQTTTLTRSYTQLSSISITLAPAAGQWRIDGGAWQTSSSTLSDLMPGAHTVDYSAVNGYTAPPAESVTLVSGQTLSLSRVYVQLAQITVTLAPATAQWNVDGGTWQASGATVANLSPGSHTLGYAPLADYDAPSADSVTLAAGQSLTLIRSYTAHVGELTVHGLPAAAVASGVKFVVDDDASTPRDLDTVLTLPVGQHTISFNPAPGWIVPAPLTVTVNRDALTTATALCYYSHRLRFFLHQDLVGTMPLPEVQRRLAQYAAHLKLLLERDTLRRFTFDPATDITVCTANPLSGNAYGDLPEIGYELWLYVQLSTNATFGTYGGYASIDQSGAGGAAGLYWDQIYDPSVVPDTSTALMQYWRQLHHITHEIEHNFGAGLGEYYSLGGLHDASGVEPLVADSGAVNGSMPTAFWNAHPEYLADPLLAEEYGNPRIGSPTTLAALLDISRFAPVTIGLANGTYRNFSTWAPSLPDMNAVVVKVIDAGTAQLIPGATVRVWNRNKPAPPYDTYEESVVATATPGVFTFHWTGAPLPLNNYENAKVVKAYAPGYTPNGLWAIVYDAQKAKVVDGSTVFEITVALTPQ